MAAEKSSDTLRLIVGLGNPGPRYLPTRHNAGFRVADELAADYSAEFKAHPKTSALAAEWRADGLRWIVLKPQTFMNRSGEAVAAALRFWKIPLPSLLVVVDDVELEPGGVRLRAGGGDGGHNGLGSIVELLGTREFARLRVGIGRPSRPEIPLADWLLAPFEKTELLWLETSIKSATCAVKAWAREGLTVAMNRYNRKTVPDRKLSPTPNEPPSP